LAFESLHRLQTADNSALAFVYCDHTIQGEQTPANLIASLLGQLTNRLPSDHPLIHELLEQQSSNKLLDLASGIDYVRRICTCKSFSAVRLGADGLDELLPQHRCYFLRELARLSHVAKVQFLFFGRDNSGIQDDVNSSFQAVGIIPVHFRITGEMTLLDRRLFLLETLQTHRNGRTFDHALQDLILDKLAPSDSTYVLGHPRTL
jgi:hypothetical protein